MKFNDFRAASERAKERVLESRDLSYKKILEEELAKAVPSKESRLQNNQIQEVSLDITEEEIAKISEEARKAAEDFEVNETALNEGEGFDFKGFLIKTANYFKGMTAIPGAVAKKWKAKIEGLQKETEFEDKWGSVLKKEEEKLKQEFAQKIANAPTAQAKTSLRGKRDAQIDALEAKLADVKTAKLKAFKQSTVDKENSANERISALEKPQSGLPEGAASVLSGIKTQAEIEGEIAYAEEKVKQGDEKAKKKMTQLQQRLAGKLKELKEDQEAAATKMAEADAAASKSIDDLQPTGEGDNALTDDEKAKFEECKEAMKTANSTFGEFKSAYNDLRTAADKLQSEIEKPESDQDETAIETAESEYDSAAEDYSRSKTTTTRDIGNAISKCKDAGKSDKPDLKSLGNNAEGFEKMKEMLDAVELPSKPKA